MSNKAAAPVKAISCKVSFSTVILSPVQYFPSFKPATVNVYHQYGLGLSNTIPGWDWGPKASWTMPQQTCQHCPDCVLFVTFFVTVPCTQLSSVVYNLSLWFKCVASRCSCVWWICKFNCNRRWVTSQIISNTAKWTKQWQKQTKCLKVNVENSKLQLKTYLLPTFSEVIFCQYKEKCFGTLF